MRILVSQTLLMYISEMYSSTDIRVSHLPCYTYIIAYSRTSIIGTDDIGGEKGGEGLSLPSE